VPSALAVLRLSGEVASVLSPVPLDAELPPVLANLLKIDHGLAGCSPDGSIWFTPHGSPGGLRAIRQALLERGWQEQPPGEPDPDFLQALAPEGATAYQREATRLLPGAPSRAAAELLLRMASLPPPGPGFVAQRMLADWPLVAPWLRLPVVMLVGEPNAGKSTLFNRLAADRSAITSPEPGTTRDMLRARWELPNGAAVELVDAPGLRDESATKSLGERAGMSLAREALQRADLRLVCQPRHLPRPLIEGLHLATMLDTGAPPHWADLCVSALTGEGLEDLAWGVAGTLFPSLPTDRPLPLSEAMASDAILPGFTERWWG